MPEYDASKVNAEVSNSGVSDEVLVEIKGPDPQHWGDDADRPVAGADQPDLSGLAIGEIRNEGTDEEVKGPGEYWQDNQA